MMMHGLANFKFIRTSSVLHILHVALIWIKHIYIVQITPKKAGLVAHFVPKKYVFRATFTMVDLPLFR